MLSQAPSSSLKLSRRSACDRCKAYKLKCIREGKASDPCQRCAKADLSCTTTVEQATVDAASTQSKRSHEQRKASARQVQKVARGDSQRNAADSEAKGNSAPRLLPRNPDQNPVMPRVTHYPRLLPRQLSSEQPHGVPLNSVGGGLSSHFSMVCMASADSDSLVRIALSGVLESEMKEMNVTDYRLGPGNICISISRSNTQP